MWIASKSTSGAGFEHEKMVPAFALGPAPLRSIYSEVSQYRAASSAAAVKPRADVIQSQTPPVALRRRAEAWSKVDGKGFQRIERRKSTKAASSHCH